MPVIVNELEVITEAPPPTPAPAGDDSPRPTAPTAPSPEDIEAIERYQAERASRLYAG